jgi:hypothetical protein
LLRPVLDGDELDADDSDVRDEEGVRQRAVDEDDEADEVESLFSSRSVKL